MGRSGKAILVVGIVFFLFSGVILTRSPLVWRDEVQFASMALSLLRDGTGTPSVLAEDPRMPFSYRFYGPAFPVLGALAFKLFGISQVSFRAISLLAGLSLAIACAYFVLLLSGSKVWAALAFSLTILSPEFGATATSGRMDTLAVGCEWMGMALLLAAIQSAALRSGILLCIGAGTVWTLAALSTPRALPFFFCLTIWAPILLRLPLSLRQRAFAFYLATGLLAVSLFVTWLLFAGLTPLSWLRDLSAMSSTARSYAIIGGYWHLRPSPLWLLTPLAASALLVCAGLNRRKLTALIRREHTLLHWIICGVTVNAVFSFVISARPEGYGLYSGLPLLIVSLVLVASVAPDNLSGVARLQVCVLSIIVVFGLVRLAKLGDVFATWRARDPQAAAQFVRANVPAGSRVLGPLEFYFYAVEQADSTYRFHEPLHDRNFPFRDDQLNPAYEIARQKKYGATFLLWPANRALPLSCRCESAPLVAEFKPQRDHAFFYWPHPSTGGYPPARLYRLPDDFTIEGK